MLFPQAIFAVGAVKSVQNSLGGFVDASTGRAATFPVIHATNDTGNNNGTTVNMFLDDAFGGNASFAASVVTACATETIYALQCVSAFLAGPLTCGPAAEVCSILYALDLSVDCYPVVTNISFQKLTITAAPTTFAISTTLQELGVSVDLYEGCKLDGTTAATCSASASGTRGLFGVSTSSTTTLVGTDYHRFDVPITGGADKLVAAATQSCEPKPSTTRMPTSSTTPARQASAAPALQVSSVMVIGLACAGTVLSLLLM